MALPTVDAAGVSVINRDTDAVIYTKNPTTAYYNASLTKLMTTHVVLQRYASKAAMEVVDVTIVAGDLTAGGTGNNLSSGDVWTLWQLMINLLIASSNNSALAIARVIGQEILDDEEDEITDPVVRFVTEMNAEATTLGMDDTTYTTPHGFETSHSITATDLRIVYDEVMDNADIRSIFVYGRHRLTIDRGGAYTLAADSDLSIFGAIGMRALKTGTGGGRHLGALWEAPNGQEFVIVLLNGSSEQDTFDDFDAIVAQLVIDDASLGTPAAPWTPAVPAASPLSMAVRYWDASDDDAAFQDAAETTPADDGDPVDRWRPSYESASGDFFRSDAGSARPTRTNDAGRWSMVGDGGDYMLAGTEIGDTALFAGGSEAFIWMVRFNTTDPTGTIFSKSLASSSSTRQLQFYVENSGSNPNVFLRGTGTAVAADMYDGGSNLAGGSFDGTVYGHEAKRFGALQIQIGTASEQATAEIGILANGQGTAFRLDGGIEAVFICDGFDVRTLQCARDFMQGGTPNQVPDPSGGASVSASGSLIDGATEYEVQTSGAETLNLLLTGATWHADIATNFAVALHLFPGLEATTSQVKGWNNVIITGLDETDLERVSDTLLRLTLPAFGPSYNIDDPETIGIEVSHQALVGAVAPITAPETFVITPTPEDRTGTTDAPAHHGRAALDGGVVITAGINAPAHAGTAALSGSVPVGALLSAPAMHARAALVGGVVVGGELAAPGHHARASLLADASGARVGALAAAAHHARGALSASLAITGTLRGPAQHAGAAWLGTLTVGAVLVSAGHHARARFSGAAVGARIAELVSAGHHARVTLLGTVTVAGAVHAPAQHGAAHLGEYVDPGELPYFLQELAAQFDHQDLIVIDGEEFFALYDEDYAEVLDGAGTQPLLTLPSHLVNGGPWSRTTLDVDDAVASVVTSFGETRGPFVVETVERGTDATTRFRLRAA